MVYLGCFQREEALSVRQKFVATEGDHITLLNIFRAHRTSKEDKVSNSVS